ncbi:MAG: metallophosphoesterase [Ilumatobacter sp.]|uniref:metallophosphoesterase family protein n=1 Tax=Ilumatobacter sp. TaxID=1967498 RepID=UPI0026228A6D|nr:metallophosphoesterase [Ilumatobacter sp.]MDJ0769673.1 metallophosphoesterase [Ilumatobacter sp.]
MELTTVADDLVVIHDGSEVHRHDGLAPDREYRFSDMTARTLPRPPGELLVRIATVNDVHFGETECGRIDDHAEGPIMRSKPGDDPYPEVMNRAAADEMAAADVDAVVVKGDLSTDGLDHEWEAFEACYREPFGDRLHVVRGNHDAYHGQTRYAGDRWIDLPGLTIGLLDTVIPTETTGGLRREQLDAADAQIARRDERVLLMGHHQQWIAKHSETGRSDDYFGLHPDASDALDELCARRSNVIGYTAGHTHRHRVRPMTRAGVPSVEVGCVKDFPGTWAEYRVYEGGVMQVVHRMSSPASLEWSERCRFLYSDFGVDYETYALGTLAERCFVFPDRTSA